MYEIIALCPKEYPGVTSVFRHGENLGLWKLCFLGEEIPENKLVILGAWHPAYAELLEKHKCAIYITSTFGQMEFSHNRIEIEQYQEIIRLADVGKLVAVLSGYWEVANYSEKFLKEKSFWCPYPFEIKEQKLEPDWWSKKEKNSTGIFLPDAPRKNTLNQIIAAAEISDRVYTNLPFVGIKVVSSKGWIPEPEYSLRIKKLMVTLHCTFTESFSYAAAESLVLGTIPIVSLQVAENLGFLENWENVCLQCDSSEKIMRSIKEIFELGEKSYLELLDNCQKAFKMRMASTAAITRNVLDKVLALVV